MRCVWSLLVYPTFTVLSASYCRAIDIVCRVMDTSEADIGCAVALLIVILV